MSVVVCRHQFQPISYHQQVATLIDMRDLGQPDAKLQSCITARPGMKLSGKEDEAIMGLVTGWWQVELADDKCWAVVDVMGRMKLLVRYQNRPAGDYHAVCASFKHQGSGSAWPCLWCEVRNGAVNSRHCKECQRYSCHHTAFNGIHPGIVPLKEVSPDQLGEQPASHATTVESSREGLQPRRKQQPGLAERSSNAQSKAGGGYRLLQMYLPIQGRAGLGRGLVPLQTRSLHLPSAARSAPSTHRYRSTSTLTSLMTVVC